MCLTETEKQFKIIWLSIQLKADLEREKKKLDIKSLRAFLACSVFLIV